MSDWYKKTTLGEMCCDNEHCDRCDPDGNCDICDAIDGRWMEAVCEYASTCDGCGELTHHAYLTPENEDGSGLGYCDECIKNEL